MKEFFYQLMGDTVGPLTSTELREAAEHQTVTPETMVRVGRPGNWVPASRITGLFNDAGQVPPPAPFEPEWLAAPVHEIPRPSLPNRRRHDTPPVREFVPRGYGTLEFYASLCTFVGFVGLACCALGLIYGVHEMVSENRFFGTLSLVYSFIGSVGRVGSLALGEGIEAYIDLLHDADDAAHATQLQQQILESLQRQEQSK